MELWIRSQDKMKLVKVNELSLYDSNILKNDFVLNYEPNHSNISIIANDNYNLGSYKSKERALEVLDEIQEAKLGNFHYRFPSNVKISQKEDTIVYEMPKE